MEITNALFGAGCFWGVEDFFKKIDGVLETKVGYAGGEFLNPTYEDVCSGNTGHAEVVFINFNNEVLTFANLLDYFWQCHDPTQLNRQGFDIGSQYRSVIYFYSETQKKIAISSKNKIQKNFNKNIQTEIKKYTNFYLAESYHQCYIQKIQNKK